MPGAGRSVVGAVAVLLLLAGPAYAAPTGVIEGGVASADWSTGTGSFSVTYDGCGPGCDWAAVATIHPTSRRTDCFPDPYPGIDTGVPSWIWGSVTQTANGTASSGPLTFHIGGQPGEYLLCLYFVSPTVPPESRASTIVASKLVQPPPAPPLPGGPGEPSPLPRLTVATARAHVRAALRRRYGAAFRKGKAKRINACRRLTRLQVRCRRVSWTRADRRYSGWVTIRYVRAGAGVAWRSEQRIRMR